MTRRSKKDEFIDKVADALGRFILAVILAFLAVLVPVWGARELLGKLDYETLRWLALMLLFCVPVVAYISYRAARLEVRGFLGGFNTGADTTVNGIAKVVDIRDKSKVRVAKASQKPQAPIQPEIQVLLPNPGQMPAITHRSITNERVLEL